MSDASAKGTPDLDLKGSDSTKAPSDAVFRKNQGLITADYSLNELEQTDVHGVAKGESA
jgi:hypothetical protein